MITTSGSDKSSVETAGATSKLPVLADARGRLRVTKAQRREILAALARSGESLPRFARRTGLKYSTLANWVKHSRPSKPTRRQPRLRLMEAVVESPPGPSGALLILRLPGGVRVEVADEKQAALAALVVRGLAGPC